MTNDFTNMSISRLEDVYGEWLTENGFNDEWLTVEDLRHEHGSELTNAQREWLADFEVAWNTRQAFEDKVDALAKKFSTILREWLTEEEMSAVIERNRADGYPTNICHSHDFCDANMAMDEAFTKVMGREYDFGNENGTEDADLDLINAMWMQAKLADFKVEGK